MKAASDILSPVSGDVTEVNTEITEAPEIINKDPYGAGRCKSTKTDSYSISEKAGYVLTLHLYI